MSIKPYFILILLALVNLKLLGQDSVYTKSELISDLKYLKNQLEQNHPNLYTYSSKTTVDNWFENKYENLPNTINQAEAFEIITSFSSILKDGHSYIYPSAKHLEDFFNSSPLFPLDVFLINDSLVVVRNFSNEQNISIGSTLTKINGMQVADILDLIVQHTCRDGNNLEYPKHLTYQFFSAYYSYFFGFKDHYVIEFIDENNKLNTVEITGLPRSEIKSKRVKTVEKGIDFKVFPNGYSAVLTIKSFDKKILKNDYNQNFKKEIKAIFRIIEEKQIKNLAIDLRDNQGGELSNGIYLLKHFMDSSFQCVNSYYKVKNGRNKKFNAGWSKFFKPNKDAFEGKVYVFTNGGSFSCSAVFANTVKETNRGKIVGEMTGGSAYVNSGAPNEVVILPNTKISFTIPKTQYNLRKDLNNIGLGVMPDVKITDNPNKILNGQDDCIEYFEQQ
ncbi:MAG: S41 family peptidase [Flavobacteriaceae bacterium]